MKILLAIDGSEYSQTAVNQLAKLPFSPQTEVRIMSVFANSLWTNTSELTITGGTLDKYYDQATAAARKSAEDLVANAAQVIKAKNTSLSVTTTVQDGIPKNAILDEAEAYGIDLIVVGSHGHNSLSRFLLGSVSHFVSLYAHCSVMIVRKRNE